MWQLDVRQEHGVTAALVSLLAPGSRLSDWAHHCHQAAAAALIWATSPLISAWLKVWLWEPALSEKTGWRWAPGADWARLHPLSHRRGWGGGPKESAGWLSQRLWGKCQRSSVTQTLLTKSSVSCKCSRELFYLADCQPFHTLKFQSRHSSKHLVLSCIFVSSPKDFFFLAHLQSYSHLHTNNKTAY